MNIWKRPKKIPSSRKQTTAIVACHRHYHVLWPPTRPILALQVNQYLFRISRNNVSMMWLLPTSVPSLHISYARLFLKLVINHGGRCLKTRFLICVWKFIKFHVAFFQQVQEFKFLRVHYESKVTWRQVSDYLRCNTQFYGKPRYDGVLVRLDEDRTIFGKLAFVFAYKLNAKWTPFAFIQPMDIPQENLTRKDKHLHLYRIRERPRKNCIFVPIDSIIRGALIVKDQGMKRDYFVVDVIDTDWFLRCREIFGHRINW